MAFAMVQVALADNILYTGTGFNGTNSGYTSGVEFTPAVDITVDGVGVLDGGSDGSGLQVAHPVGIYTIAGALLTDPSLTVDNGDALENGFRFVTIAPLVLSAGQTYVLAAYYPAGMQGDKLAAQTLNPYPNASVSTGWRAVGGSGLAFPIPTAGAFRIAANIRFTPNSGATGDGDLNFDGKVDSADVALASRVVQGDLTPSGAQVIAGDLGPFDGASSHPDNVIDMRDLKLISRTALGTYTP